MLIDRTSKLFLKILTDESPNMDDGLFTTDYIGNKLCLDEKKTLACMRHLEDNGLLRVTMVDYPGLNTKMIWGVEPTHKAYHYVEFSVLEMVETLFKSVFLPVVVAIITTILVA